MTKIITSAEAHARRNRNIQPLVKNLQALHPHADPQVLMRFARGLAALSGIPGILNAEGLRLLKYTGGIVLAERPPLTDVESVLPQLPSIDKPQLHLFINPFPEAVLNDPQFRAFKVLFNEKGGMRIIQIATGCQNNCLMCATSPYKIGEKQSRIRFMPFPMVLLIAKQLLAENSEAQFDFYHNSEVLQWKDKNFDADFGDLAKQLLELGVKLASPTTIGFRPGDPYAERAAIKCVELGIKFQFSLHLLDKRIFPTPEAEPREKWLQIYAKRYANSISILKPRQVRLLADQDNPNKYLKHKYLEEFYDARVFPLIEEEIKDNYRRSGNPNVLRALLSNEGKAYDNPYFPETRRWIGGSLYPKGFSLMIDPYGKPIVIVPSQRDFFNRRFSYSQTVRERFPRADSSEFKNFLRKLRFILSDETLSEIDENIVLWKKLFPEFNAEKILELLSSGNGPMDFSTQVCEIVHRKMRNLSTLRRDLFYNWRACDFRQRLDRAHDELYYMFIKRIIREEDFAWRSLRHINVRAVLIKEGYIKENGEIAPKLLKETNFFKIKANFKLKGFYIGSIPKGKILEIFGENDASWREFFKNPDGERLVFKWGSEDLIKAADMDEAKRQKLLAVWKQFLFFAHRSGIFNALKRSYFGNREYRFLMSFEEGRKAIRKLGSLLKRPADGSNYSDSLDKQKTFHEILGDLPILQVVHLLETDIEPLVQPKTKVVLGFRTNTGIS